MQGLVNFSTAIADGIAVMLPAFCYITACACCFLFAWTLWTLPQLRSYPATTITTTGASPWVPFLSLILAGVFASFPHFLTMANVSARHRSDGLARPSTPRPFRAECGEHPGFSTPENTVINVVTLFQHFFQIVRRRLRVLGDLVAGARIVNGHVHGSPPSCGVQFVFGVCCINILTIANGVERLFQTGG